MVVSSEGKLVIQNSRKGNRKPLSQERMAIYRLPRNKLCEETWLSMSWRDMELKNVPKKHNLLTGIRGKLHANIPSKYRKSLINVRINTFKVGSLGEIFLNESHHFYIIIMEFWILRGKRSFYLFTFLLDLLLVFVICDEFYLNLFLTSSFVYLDIFLKVRNH